MNAEGTQEARARFWRGRRLALPLGEKTLIMGVINVTPDSFSDGGLFDAPESALAHARAMAAEGADVLDVGGESTRPGHSEVSAEEELARVLPVVRAITGNVDLPVSIDSWKAAVAARALEAGAAIVNDVWGLQRDADMARVVAEHDAAVVVMHNRAAADPAIDIMADVAAFLSRSIETALAAGVREDRIMLDPGVGFGKTAEQSMEVIRRLGEFRALGFPILLGASRKSFIGRVLGIENPADRLYGTLGAHLVGALAGADVIRAHDVAAHRDALGVADFIRGRAR